MTLQEAKDQIAKKHGHVIWCATTHMEERQLFDEVAELYANTWRKRAIENGNAVNDTRDFLRGELRSAEREIDRLKDLNKQLEKDVDNLAANNRRLISEIADRDVQIQAMKIAIGEDRPKISEKDSEYIEKAEIPKSIFDRWKDLS